MEYAGSRPSPWEISSMRIFPAGLSHIAQEDDDILADVMRDMFPAPTEDDDIPIRRRKGKYSFSPSVMRQWLLSRGVTMGDWKTEDAKTILVECICPATEKAWSEGEGSRIKKELLAMPGTQAVDTEHLGGIFGAGKSSELWIVRICFEAAPWIVDEGKYIS